MWAIREGGAPVTRWQREFEAYDREHPEVYTELVHLCNQLKSRGITKYGFSTLVHQLRWHFHVERGNAEFKLNQNYSPYYARKLANEYEQFRDLFEFRRLRAAA